MNIILNIYIYRHYNIYMEYRYMARHSFFDSSFHRILQGLSFRGLVQPPRPGHLGHRDHHVALLKGLQSPSQGI